MEAPQRILLDQSTASLRRVYFTAEDVSSPGAFLTAVDMDIGTSGAFTVKISKNGGATATPSGATITEVDDTDAPGLFYVGLASGDVDTLGSLHVYVSSAGGSDNMIPRCIPVRVSAIDDLDSVRAGLTGLVPAQAPAQVTQWTKNEVAAGKRCLTIRVLTNDGDPADRGEDFTGMVWISGAEASGFAAAVGTLHNVRRTLVVADDTVESADTGADTLTLTAHGYETGDGPFDCDEALGSITIGSDFWIIKVDANTIQVATSLANAYAGTEVALTGTEGGATISDTVDTTRGIDGLFLYVATQGETNHDSALTTVLVEGTGYLRALGGGGVAVAAMTSSSDAWGSTVLEDGHTRDDAMRIGLRTHVAPFSVADGVVTFRDLADTKDSHHGTITGSGRSDTDIDDAT